MGDRLVKNVLVDRDGTAVMLEAGTSVPAWAKDLVTNPKAFATDDLEREVAGDGSSDEDDEKGYDDLKVDELRDLLKERELPTTGTKPELIERLATDDLEREVAGDGSSDEDDENQE